MKSLQKDIIYFYVSTIKSLKGNILHQEHCELISNPLSRKYVGLFPNSLVAIEKLKENYPDLVLCKDCLE